MRGFRYLELLSHAREKLVRRKAVEILHCSVIAHNLKFVIRKEYCEEIVIRLLAGMPGVLIFHDIAHTERGCRSVMTVSNVERLHTRERGLERLDVSWLRYDPQRVAYAVVGTEVVDRAILRNDACHDFTDIFACAICEQHRACIRFQYLHMSGPVVLFLSARKLVLLDCSRLVLCNACTHHDPRLDMVTHPELVRVKAWCRIRDKHAGVDHPGQVTGAQLIDLLGMTVDAWRQIDLRLNNVKEAIGVIRRYCAGHIALRPTQDGQIAGYRGLDELERNFGEWIFAKHLPSAGSSTQPVEAGYKANAWIRMRHPDYDRLREMLDSVGRQVEVIAR